ncbi:tyrosinase family oxidase copper chaperone [Streptomyces sp. NPDC085946]|uniref:tyrosinase family oxidase copper chaperone n=1 Tax=Streptomyces sp. NPDC085946 TaxID=3365744 RepID=UPI0037CDF07A
MVASDGAMPVEAEPGPEGPAGPGRPGPGRDRRRAVTRGLFATALAAVLAPVVAASRPRRAGGPGPAGHPGPGSAEESFAETYRGRRIRGVKGTPGQPDGGVGTAAGRTAGPGRWHVTVDGRQLHLMRRADGSWLSVVDHYGSYPTPLAAARAAVDALPPGRRLREAVRHGTNPAQGGHHGVRP